MVKHCFMKVHNIHQCINCVYILHVRIYSGNLCVYTHANQIRPLCILIILSHFIKLEPRTLYMYILVANNIKQYVYYYNICTCI